MRNRVRAAFFALSDRTCGGSTGVVPDAFEAEEDVTDSEVLVRIEYKIAAARYARRMNMTMLLFKHAEGNCLVERCVWGRTFMMNAEAVDHGR